MSTIAEVVDFVLQAQARMNTAKCDSAFRLEFHRRLGALVDDVRRVYHLNTQPLLKMDRTRQLPDSSQVIFDQLKQQLATVPNNPRTE